jgi:hypothetical protein
MRKIVLAALFATVSSITGASLAPAAAQGLSPHCGAGRGRQAFGGQLCGERSERQRPVRIEPRDDRRQRRRMGAGLRSVSLACLGGILRGPGPAAESAELEACVALLRRLQALQRNGAV